MSIVAVLDACVLYPASIRDILMRLLAGNLYRGHWTNEIHDEWIRSVLKNRQDVEPQKLARTRELMDSNAIGSLITEYEHLIPTINLPDRDDRHVVAAAIKAEASLIVTFNLSDFPSSSLSCYGIEAIHPDNFILSLIERDPERCLTTVAIHRKTLKKPLKTRQEYLETLKKQGLVASSAKMDAWDF